MAAESFADDTKDGGELGAGHRVTALFEIAKTGSKQEINEVESKYGATSGSDADWAEEYLTVNVRYKEPDGDTSTLLSYPVDARSESDVMSENMSWAAGVAQFGMILKDSEFKGTSTVSEIKSLKKKVDAGAEVGLCFFCMFVFVCLFLCVLFVCSFWYFCFCYVAV